MEQQETPQTFQALKSKWAQQSTGQEQPVTISPPPIPPKPSAIVLQRALSDEGDTRKPDIKEPETLSPPKRVSLLTQQFEKTDIVTSGKFSTSTVSAPTSTSTTPKLAEKTLKPPTATKKAPPPPPPSSTCLNSQIATPLVVQSPPQLDIDPFTNHGFTDEDSDSSDDDDDDEDSDPKETNSSGEFASKLIEQVQKAHLNYTRQEDGYVGTTEVKKSPAVATNKTLKRPPPPPPPSKKYHSSTRAPPPPPPSVNITPSIIKHPQTPPSVVNIPIQSDAITVEAVSLPPILPPRPTANQAPIPQLPPRPSQSTLARAHTIASRTPPLPQRSENDPEDTLKRSTTISASKRAMSRTEILMTSSIYPDFSQATRNAPLNILEKPFSTGHKGSLTGLAASKNMVITASGVLRTWDIKRASVLNTILLENNHNTNSGQSNQDNNEKIRALVIAPCRDAEDIDRYVWVARQDTMLCLIDLKAPDQKVISKRSDVHAAPITFLLRNGNTEIWSIDHRGGLCIWDLGSFESTISLKSINTRKYEVTQYAVAATIYGSKLWMSSGRTLAVHHIPATGTQHTQEHLPSIRIPNDMGNITKLLTIPYHPNKLFASHDDGKISSWDVKTMERLQVITVSMYGICTMACVGDYHVWAGYNTGMIYVYDTRPEKWIVLKYWKAHNGAVTQLYVDESNLLLDEQHSRLQVVSSDSNGFVGVWDGLLTEHWIDSHLQKRANEYCKYDEAKVMICSWNIDANKPEKINDEDRSRVENWLKSMEDPDIIVVGIQEIVDLESKKQTARSLFFKKKTDSTETEEVLTHRYKLWHDFLIQIIAENYGHNMYTVVKTDQLVGLFSCIFVRTADMDRVFNVEATSVKTGLKVMNKSIHGNKGGIAIRFVYDHTSLCFVNCHLAAGQSHVQQRNADAEGILQSASFSRQDYADVFVHGGDGTMILDHEYCFLSGDLNYRIKMNRNDVLKTLIDPDKHSAWAKLQEQDQLLRQKINNPLFKLLWFEEAPIRFDPTYKYDPGTDRYDGSEKQRVPAWCDRVLYKGNGIKNLFYRRFEPRCSDHRPIAAGFSFKTKITDASKRDQLMAKIEEEWQGFVVRFVKEKKARYVANYERCSLKEAYSLLEKSNWNVRTTVNHLLSNK